MKYVKAILFILLNCSALAVHGQSDGTAQKPVLWNVTSSGDTLRYINIFPEAAPKNLPNLPGYYSAAQYDSALKKLQGAPENLMISSNALNLLKQSEQYPKSTSRLKSKRKPIWMPVALIVVSGAASAYFKLEANSAYDRYQHSIDKKNISKYYDLTKKYDTVSGISFVFFQVGFGWLTYELIW